MARMPGVEWIGSSSTHDNGDMTRYDIICLHTIVGNPPADAAHFSVRSDGHIYQSRDTAWRSAANRDGNHRVIAIENDDTGAPFPNWNHNDGHAVPAFTTMQIEAIARICAWVHDVHHVPLVACPDSRPTSRGIGYHRQGIDGNFITEGYAYGGRVSGGEVWTLSPGKVCPGDRRISQRPQIIQRARIIAGLEDDDMALTDRLPPAKMSDGKEYSLTVADVLVGLAQYISGNGSATAPLTNHPIGQYTGRILSIANIDANVRAIQGSLTTAQTAILAAISADANDQVDVDALAAALRENLGAEIATELAKRLAA